MKRISSFLLPLKSEICNRKMNFIVFSVFTLTLIYMLVFSASAQAGSWPQLTDTRWKNMEAAQLKSLLQNNEINARTSGGWHPGATALIHAVRGGASIEILEILIESGADLEAATEQGYTPLLFALWGTSDIQPAKFLIENGADINARNMNEATALMIALWEKRKLPPTVPMLLEQGIDIHAENEFGSTALMEAAEHGSADSIKYLVKKGSRLDHENDFGYGILQQAAANTSDPEVIKTLVELGLSIDRHDSSGWTPLTQAVNNTVPEITKTFIDLGADVNLAVQSDGRFDGTTPLLRAAGFARKAEVIDILLKAGADVNIKDSSGQTPEQLIKNNSFLQSAERSHLLRKISSMK